MSGRKGTPLWVFERHMQYALPSLLDDLVRAEGTGIADEVCNTIHQSLQHIANAASGIPDSKPILESIERFIKDYTKWNAIDGDNRKTRREHMERLRKTRNKIATRLRNRAHKEAVERHWSFPSATEMHSAFVTIVKFAPDRFPRLARAIDRITRVLSRLGRYLDLE